MGQPTKGSGVWNPGAPESKHGEVRPGSFKVECQVSKGMWGTCHQRWCASCKGWKPVAGVTGNLACPDCKAIWEHKVPMKRKPEPQPVRAEGPCNCPLCQPYYPEK